MTKKSKTLKKGSGHVKKPESKNFLFFIGVTYIVIAVIIGLSTYKYSFEIILEYAKKSLMEKADHISRVFPNESDGTLDDQLKMIESHWVSYAKLSKDEYICVVDDKSNLLLHTSSRDSKGSYVGNNALLSGNRRLETCLADLSATMNSYIGDYVSSKGEVQIAAFVPIIGTGLLLGIHRSKDRLFKEVNSRIRVFIYAYFFIFFVFLPLILLIFLLSMKSSQKKELKALEQLGETENRFTAFLENSITGCFIYQDNHFKYANIKFLSILGFESIEDLKKGFSLSDILLEDQIKSFKKTFVDQIDGPNDNSHNIVKINNRESENIWLEIFSNKIEFNGKPASFGIIVDITKRKLSELNLAKYKKDLEETVTIRTSEIEGQVDKLSKSQKAMLFMIEDLNRTSIMLKTTQDELLLKERLAILGQFSGSISHELRNPLGVIDSSAYFLLKTLKNQDEKINDHLGRIKTGVKTSTSIIESLLNLTRMKKPKLEKNELLELMDQSIKEVKLPENIRIVTKYRSKGLMINCEILQIKIALKNIIKNGIESMIDGGELKISVDNSNEGIVTIKFTDSGKGISQTNIEKIFQPLFTMKAKGIGFGLPITKMIIENHNGQINVSSVEGKGTEFTVSLPLVKTEK